jgi:hypothetical protein
MTAIDLNFAQHLRIILLIFGLICKDVMISGKLCIPLKRKARIDQAKPIREAFASACGHAQPSATG